jgi:hypothetical protein
MSLKLNSSGGGSVTLQEPSTASNLTLTLPTTTGTAVIQNASNNLLMNSGYGSDAVAYGCRAWVNFNGTSTVAIRASGNVSSITDNNTGDYTVNFTTAMPDVNYCPLVVQGNDNTGNSGIRGANVLATQVAPTTSAVRVGTWSSGTGTRSSEDSAYVFVGVTR